MDSEKEHDFMDGESGTSTDNRRDSSLVKLYFLTFFQYVSGFQYDM